MMALTSPMLVFPSASALLTRWLSPAIVSASGLIISSARLLFLGQTLQGNSTFLIITTLVMTGAGAALPWGLMHGLAISAVPVEKAAGLFNTVRVAGEGIALAMISAFLTETNDVQLNKTVHGLAPERIHLAASWLGGSNIHQAISLLPGVRREVIQISYDNAYTLLFWVLAAVTFVCALIAWSILGRKTHDFPTANTDSRN